MIESTPLDERRFSKYWKSLSKDTLNSLMTETTSVIIQALQNDLGQVSRSTRTETQSDQRLTHRRVV